MGIIAAVNYLVSLEFSTSESEDKVASMLRFIGPKFPKLDFNFGVVNCMGSSAGFVIKNRYAKYKATTTLSAANAAATASGRVRNMSETAGIDKNGKCN